MASIQGSRRLADALQAEGLLPPNCKLIEVNIPADGAITIEYTVFVTNEDLAKVARALQRAAETGVGA